MGEYRHNISKPPNGRPTIGFLCEHLVDEYSASMWAGVRDAAWELGAAVQHQELWRRAGAADCQGHYGATRWGIEISSQAGVGTTVVLWLPISNAEDS